MKTAKFKTKQDAVEAIEQLDSGTYYLNHGEYARPSYSARKVRGENKYYILAKYFYYAGTFYAKQDGPITENELYLIQT